MPPDHMELEAATGERPRRRLHPLAGASFLLGLLSPLFAVAAAAAVVTGLWARRSIRRSEGRARGNILAFMGAGLGCIGLAIQGISAYQAVMYYREVTPVAEEFLTLVGENQWLETYDKFSPRYRREIPLHTPRGQTHEQEMRNLFGRADRYDGLRWAYRFPPPREGRVGDEVRVTYDVRFSNGRGRFTFHFVKTQRGWLIDRVRGG